MMLEEKLRTLSHAPHPRMTLKSAVPCVKATSRSSTARPQEKDSLIVRRRPCAVSNHEALLILRDARQERAPQDEEKSQDKESVPAIGLFHRRELLGTGGALIG